MKAVILDMYGVILEQTGDDFFPYIQNFFPKLSHEDIYKVWDKADVGEISSLEVWRALGFTGDLEETERKYLETIRLNEGFSAFAEEVKKSSKLALISNDSSRWSKYLREKFGMNKYFDSVCVSGDLKMKKPNEGIFLHCLKELGCKAEDCIYVDDRRGNLEAAAALGMDTVMFISEDPEYSGKHAGSFSELTKLLCL